MATSAGESSGYESELEESLSLALRADLAAERLRSMVAFVVSLTASSMSFHTNRDSFKGRMRDLVRDGTKTVVSIQKWRNPFLDVYFQIFSFFGEEEFYLLLLPFLIWNVDRVLGRRLTILVTAGLFIGNVLKDVFQFPRPSSPPVWRPKHQDKVDSTSLQDFGFPSTHAMNSVSNSLFVFLYFTTSTVDFDLSHILRSKSSQFFFLGCLFYIISLSGSRLYLGAHTPIDIKGGVALGLIWTALFFPSSLELDSWIFHAQHLGLKLVVGAVCALILNPQPRPPTPSFAQNALICGLLIGTSLGSRHYADLGTLKVASASASIGGYSLELGSIFKAHQTLSGFSPYTKGLIRTSSGYTVVIVLRAIAKAMASALVKCVVNSSNEPGKAARRSRRVRLFSRDLEVVAAAFVKIFTYAVISWSITFFVPVLHVLFGLAEYNLSER